MKTISGKPKPKLFVLDTNVLLHDPGSLYHFKDNDIFLPMCVLEELDGKKKGMTDVAHNARQACRLLDELLACAPRNIADGIPLKSCTGRVYLQTGIGAKPKKLPYGMDPKKADNTILSAVLSLQSKKPEHRVLLVSKDTNMRIKARALGIEVQDYKNDMVVEDPDLLYSGTMALNWKVLSQMRSWTEGPATYYEVCGPACSGFCVNMFLLLEGPKPLHARVVKRSEQSATIVTLKDYTRHPVKGIMARNPQQSQALSLLMNPEIDLVTILGQAGTGKTLLALAAALEQEHLYPEIIFTRATVPADGSEEIGFLTGNEKEKLTPWMGALYDNLDVLQSKAGSLSQTKNKRRRHNDPKENEKESVDLRSRVAVKSLNFMRGRTFLEKFLIIDEAQNLTPRQIKTLITRAGPGTKVVCMGNLAQIDTPYLSEVSSGLTYLVDRFKGWEHFGIIKLEGVERSRLAARAVEVL